METVCTDISGYLDSPKSAGGAGCSPAAYHGGQYNGKDAVKVFSLHEEIFTKVPETFSKKLDHKVLFSTLNLIFSKTRLGRFLSATERAELEKNVINLSKILFMKFKHKSITVKMHDVLGMKTICFI